MSSRRVGDAFVGLNATVSRGQSPTGFNFWSLGIFDHLGHPSTNLIVTFRLGTSHVYLSLSGYSAAGKGAADELAPSHSVYAYPKNPPQINVAWIPAAEAAVD